MARLNPEAARFTSVQGRDVLRREEAISPFRYVQSTAAKPMNTQHGLCLTRYVLDQTFVSPKGGQIPFSEDISDAKCRPRHFGSEAA